MRRAHKARLSPRNRDGSFVEANGKVDALGRRQHPVTTVPMAVDACAHFEE